MNFSLYIRAVCRAFILLAIAMWAFPAWSGLRKSDSSHYYLVELASVSQGLNLLGMTCLNVSNCNSENMANYYPCLPTDHLKMVKDSSFLETILPLLAGKSVELLQNDLCAYFLRNFLGDGDWTEYCNSETHLPLSRATAKSLGKLAKTFEAKKSGMAFLSAGLSTFASVKFSERLLCFDLPLANLFFLTGLTTSVEQFSQVHFANKILDPNVQEYYLAFDHWIGRPFLLRTATLTSRYSLEKMIRTNYMDTLFQEEVASIILKYSYYNGHNAAILAKGVSIGLSKVATGAMAASIISISELAYDAMADTPEYATLETRLSKLLSDTSSAALTNIVVAAILPSTLVSFTPRGVLLAFLVGHTVHFTGLIG